MRSNRYKHGKAQSQQQRYSADLSTHPALSDVADTSSDISPQFSIHSATITKSKDDFIHQSKSHTKFNEENPAGSEYSQENPNLLNYAIQTNNNRMQRRKDSNSFVQESSCIDNKEVLGNKVSQPESITDAQRNDFISAALNNSNTASSNPNFSGSQIEISEPLSKESIKDKSSNQTPLSFKSQSEYHPSSTPSNKTKESPLSDKIGVGFTEQTSVGMPRQIIKETVFASEIHSIEYDSSIAGKSNASNTNEAMVEKGNSVDTKKGVPSVASVQKSSNLGALPNFPMKSHIDTTLKNKANMDTMDLTRPRQEEMVVFDDIGDMNLQYISNSTSNLIKNTNDPNLQQLVKQEPKNNCDVNVTYDLIQGTLPPPSTSGLRVRPQDDHFVSNNHAQVTDTRPMEESIDNLYLGEEASATLPNKTSQESDILSSPVDNAMLKDNSDSREHTQCKPLSILNNSKKSSGLVEIAQYEGSPRRYKPRISSDILSNASSGDDRPLASSQHLIDEEQNNLLLHSPQKQIHSRMHALDSTQRDEGDANVSMVDELLRFDDVGILPQSSDIDVPGNIRVKQDYNNVSNIQPSSGIDGMGTNVNRATLSSTDIVQQTKSDFDFRYEFSETRKVLDEFFNNAENEFPVHSNLNPTAIKGSEFEHVNVTGDERSCVRNEAQNERSGNDFNDLNYTLRRFSPNTFIGNTAVGQRLAGNEEELISNTLISNSASSAARPSNINNIPEQRNTSMSFNVQSKSVEQKNDDFLSQNNMIQEFGTSKLENHEAPQSINAEQHQIPSNTYHIQRQMGDMQSKECVPLTSAELHLLSTSITDLSCSTSSMTSGFRAVDNPTHIPTSDKVETSTCQSDTNHIKNNSDDIIMTEQTSMKDTQNIMWDNSSQAGFLRPSNNSFVIPTDPNYANTFVNPMLKETSVSNTSEVSSQSRNPRSSPKSTTAIVGNMRLNVARHYLNEPGVEQQQQIHYGNRELNILGFEDTSCNNNNQDNINCSTIHTQMEKSHKELSKSSMPIKSPFVSEHKNIGTETINTTNVSFQSTTLGAEKDNTVVHSIPTMPSSLAPTGAIDSRNFTLSPETTDCDSADLESEVSINEGSYHSSGPKFHTAMPILEDGLSSGHASDLEDDIIYSR